MADIAAVAHWFVLQLHGFQMLPQVYSSPYIKEKILVSVKSTFIILTTELCYICEQNWKRNDMQGGLQRVGNKGK